MKTQRVLEPRTSRGRQLTIQMSSTAKRLLQYGAEDRQRFQSYFHQPKPKRGRPKKKKKKDRPKKRSRVPKKQCMISLVDSSASETEDDRTIDLVVKDHDELDARLEGVVNKALRDKTKRINWDVEPNFSLRGQLGKQERPLQKG